jgi:bifunctional ADP-heptose synthase (sugar kinase/adenylyltransferase)
MLDDASLEKILNAIPRLTVGVLGDLFLDRYLDLDGALTERSIETGLDAYQVVGIRPSPGAAGTVINNLVALGVKRVAAISVIGDDGEGYELLWALKNYHVVDSRHIYSAADWRTPTYTKPMLREGGKPPRELNRFDIKNHQPLRLKTEALVLHGLHAVWPRLDALLVVDQIAPPAYGIITERVVQRLAELGEASPNKLILADSRSRIGVFRSVWLKPNRDECMHAIRQVVPGPGTTETCVADLAQHVGRPVFCTCGEDGIIVGDPRPQPATITTIPAFPVSGPIDIVGAGDSTSAAIACAIAAGADLTEAAGFGNLVASITIQQVGTTGTANPAQIRERWREVNA